MAGAPREYRDGGVRIGSRRTTSPASAVALPARRGIRLRLAHLLAILILAVTAAPPARAQPSPPFVPVDHWIHDALRRLYGLGPIEEGYDPSGRSIPEHEASRTLQDALRARRRDARRALVRGYGERFGDEQGRGWHDPPAGSSAAIGMEGALGLGIGCPGTRHDGTAGSIQGDSAWDGPTAIPSGQHVPAIFALRAYVDRHAAGSMALTRPPFRRKRTRCARPAGSARGSAGALGFGPVVRPGGSSLPEPMHSPSVGPRCSKASRYPAPSGASDR